MDLINQRAAPDVLVNSSALARLPGLGRTREPLAVHRRLPGYAPTPLVACPGLAVTGDQRDVPIQQCIQQTLLTEVQRFYMHSAWICQDIRYVQTPQEPFPGVARSDEFTLAGR